VVEIDLTHPSLDSFPIYAALGVAEVWRYDGQHVWFYRLGGRGYAPVETSTVLTGVTTQDIESSIERSRDTDRQVLFDEVRAWAGC
jgi:Uma2 family endonuclease